MKLLQKLVRGLSPKEWEFLSTSVFNYQDKEDDTLFLKFLDLVKESSRNLTDDQCSQILYGELPGARYMTLKSRLKTRLINALCFAEFNSGALKKRSRESHMIGRLLAHFSLEHRLGGACDLSANYNLLYNACNQSGFTLGELFALSGGSRLANYQDRQRNIRKMTQASQRMILRETAWADTYQLFVYYVTANAGNRECIIQFLAHCKASDWYKSTQPFLTGAILFTQILEEFLSLRSDSVRGLLEHFKAVTLYHSDSLQESSTAALLEAEFLFMSGDLAACRKILKKVNPSTPAGMARLFQIRFNLGLVTQADLRDTFPSKGCFETMYHFFPAALSFQNGSFKDCLRLLNIQCKSDSLMAGWHVHMRILRLVCWIETGNPAQAAREADTLRKQLYKLPIALARERKLVTLLRSLAIPSEGTEKALRLVVELARAEGPLSRRPLSAEIISVHEWAAGYLEKKFSMTG